MRTVGTMFCCLLLLGGCASNRAYRALASSTGIYVENLKVGTAEFIAEQNTLNAENADRLDRMAGFRESEAQSSRRQQLAWTVGKNDAALASYSAATSVSGEAVVAQMSSAATRASALDDAGAAEAYGKASDALGKLAAKPSNLHVLAGLLAYADAVNTAYDDLKDKAKKDAAATGRTTDTADTQIVVEP